MRVVTESLLGMGKALWVIAMFSVLGFAQQSSLEKMLIRASKNVSPAVLPIMDWGELGGQRQVGVIGSAFLINDQGYFLTAGHVVAQHRPDSGRITVIVRQSDGNGVGRPFEVIERDEAHDLALCRIMNFRVSKSTGAAYDKPFASLAISPVATETGSLILVVGFPLGSWAPTVQFGIVAATETVNPAVQGVPAGRKELMQVAVSGNKGNSGCPVIELSSGRVVGVIIQALPAPLFTQEDRPLPVAQSSGVMLAAPASWIGALLERHNVKSMAVKPGTKSVH